MIIGNCPVCGAEMRVGTDITNADRIRAMSDEELAEWLTNFSSSTVKPYATARVKMYRGSLLDWLKQEATDG